MGRPVSPVRLFTLVGGLTGTFSGFAFTIWSSLKWNLITGGKPVISIPPFVVIAFELTILFAGLCTFLGLLLLARLPKRRSSPDYDPCFPVDRFGLAVRCPIEMADAVRRCRPERREPQTTASSRQSRGTGKRSLTSSSSAWGAALAMMAVTFTVAATVKLLT